MCKTEKYECKQIPKLRQEGQKAGIWAWKGLSFEKKLASFFFLRTELECSCSFHLGPPINQGSRMHFFLLLSIAHYDSRKVQAADLVTFSIYHFQPVMTQSLIINHFSPLDSSSIVVKHTQSISLSFQFGHPWMSPYILFTPSLLIGL